jgi:hypothetical protein
VCVCVCVCACVWCLCAAVCLVVGDQGLEFRGIGSEQIRYLTQRKDES